MIYAMSDIHGYLDVLQSNLERIDLTGRNRLVLLGDYIDYGPESGQTLRCVYLLQQRYGAEKVIVLRGNHEEMLLDWLDTFPDSATGEPDASGLAPWNEWLETDRGYATFRTLITPEQWERFRRLCAAGPDTMQNLEAAHMVRERNGDLIAWLRRLPYFYETERQIFVHAGVDEDLGDWWRQGTPESMFVGKYPPSTGEFYKDIIAGHVGTSWLAKDPGFHGVWHDGASHWYLDGTVNRSGRIPILTYDERTGEYGGPGGDYPKRANSRCQRSHIISTT